MTITQRRHWMPDWQCKACTACGASFTLLRRRHHCRFCGKIFCAGCSGLGRHFGSERAVRVCEDCRRLDAVQSGGGGGGGGGGGSGGGATGSLPAAAAGLAAGGEGGNTGERAGGGGSGGARRATGGEASSASGGGGGIEAAAGGARCGGAEWELRAGLAGGGGLGLFDERERLSPPVGAPFNLPAHRAAAEALRGLAAAAEAHLVAAVEAAVRATISEPGAAALAAASDPGAAARAATSEPLGPNRAAWAAAILRLVRRACALVDPNIRRGDRADLRCYVQVSHARSTHTHTHTHTHTLTPWASQRSA